MTWHLSKELSAVLLCSVFLQQGSLLPLDHGSRKGFEMPINSETQFGSCQLEFAG